MQFKLIKELTTDRTHYIYFFQNENDHFISGTLTACRVESDDAAQAKAMQECEEKLKMVMMPREKEIIKTLEL